MSTELITTPSLTEIQTALESTRSRLIHAEEVFLATTLADRLKIGLRCYQAHMTFAIAPDQREGIGGRGRKTQSHRDGVGFESWLTAAVPWLKKPTAYKYMTAFRGLGLDQDSTEAEVDAVLQPLVGVTLQTLIAAATDTPVKPQALPPAAPTQLSFEDYLATLKSFREDAETVIEQAKDMPENLRKAACARAYATLAALTGTAWQPADEHDELGTIDPDNLPL